MFNKLFKAIACILVFSLAAPIMVFAAEFNDVTEGNTFYKEIEALSSAKVISGYKDGTFKPNNVVTRAQAAVMIGKAVGLSGELQDAPFDDVNADVTGAGYIASAAEKGIISGFTDGTFRPYASVTRGQMAIFLNRAFKLAEAEENHFRDISPEMASYQAILNVAASRITGGYPDQTYRPNESVTRGQFSAFMARSLGLVKLPETSGLSYQQIMNLMVEQQENIENVIYNYFNRPFNEVRPYFLQYATENFTDGDLRYIYENSCTECDSSYFPWILEFDIAFEVKEDSPNRIVAESAELENELSSGGFYTYTFVKENGKWLMDNFEYTPFSEKSLNLTKDEARNIIVNDWYNENGILRAVTFVKEQLVRQEDYYTGGSYLVNQYIFQLKIDNRTETVLFYPDSGYYRYEY